MVAVSDEFMANLDREWIEDMLLYSFDRCLHSRTYSVSVCIDFLKPLLPYLTNRALEYMQRVITNSDSDDYDSKWNLFLILLVEEINSRKSADGWR